MCLMIASSHVLEKRELRNQVVRIGNGHRISGDVSNLQLNFKALITSHINFIYACGGTLCRVIIHIDVDFANILYYK